MHVCEVYYGYEYYRKMGLDHLKKEGPFFQYDMYNPYAYNQPVCTLDMGDTNMSEHRNPTKVSKVIEIDRTLYKVLLAASL